MFSSRNRLALTAAIGWAAMAAGAAHADALVVRSIGPSAKLYPPGKSVSDQATLTLAATDQVTLLDGQGTRTLKGPGTFNLASAAGAAQAPSRFAALMNARSTQHARIGAVRGATVPRHSPNIWYVDASRGGPMCVVDASSVTLWRAEGSADALLTVKGPGGAKVDVAFAKGETAAAWPASLPVARGAQYALSWAGKPSTSIRFALLGASAGGLEDTASALIRNGCSAQLDLLVDVMSLPDTSAAPQG
jgi:hypothetical protein